jgi:multidrug efflux pump subunit AcrB
LILAAQFESFIDPFIIILTVPGSCRCFIFIVVLIRLGISLVKLEP